MSDEMANRMAIESGISPGWLLAGDVRTKPVALYDQPYTTTLYDAAQSKKRNRWNPDEGWIAMDALDLSARLLAILENAREHNYQLAIYKAITTVQALGAEFGQDTSIYEPTEPYHYPKQALKALTVRICARSAK